MPLNPKSRSMTLASICLAAAVVCQPASVGANCALGKGKVKEGADRLGALDIGVTASEKTDCGLQPAAPFGRSKVSGVRVSFDHGPVEAQYGWARSTGGPAQWQGITLTPLEHARLESRIHARHGIDPADGVRHTRVEWENGLDLGRLNTTASIVRDAAPRQRSNGVNIGANGLLPGDALFARLDYSGWLIRDRGGRSRRLSHGLMSLELKRGNIGLHTSYAHTADSSRTQEHAYRANAEISQITLGDRRHTAVLKAEVSKQAALAGEHSISLIGNHNGRRNKHTAKLSIGRSASGLQDTTLSVTRSAGAAFSIEGAIRIIRGNSNKDASLTLAASHRF